MIKKKLRTIWCKQETGHFWGALYPQFYIFKDGKKYFLEIIFNPKTRQKKIIRVDSYQQGKRIATKMLNLEYNSK